MNVLLWAKGGAQYQATTDDTGTFHIDEVTPGSYRARFAKEGFVPLQRDQPPVVVTRTEPARIRVEMTPYATLRGRVVDPEGKPAAHVEVEVRSAEAGFAAFTTTTGSDGSFVFDHLSLGSFLLYAKPKPEPAVRYSDRGRVELVPTYFPSIEERVQAEKILVRAGLDLSGYEIRLRAAPVYRISGTVVDESGQPEPHATLALISTAEGMSMSGPPDYGTKGVIVFGILRRETETGATADEDGRFAFASVRSGSWRLLSHSRGKGGAAIATLADHDLDDVQIRLAPLFTLTGTAEFKGDPPQKQERQGGLMLTTTDMLGGYITIFNRPDGTVRVPNLMPGAYRMVSLPARAGAYSPVSVLLGDREVLGQVVQLTDTSPPLRILYSANTGVVRGTVEKGGCELIVLLPNPLIPPAASRAEPCKNGGPFEIAGVPSGQYYALAFDRVDRTMWPDDAFLRTVTQNAATVQVGQGLRLRSN